MLVVVALMAVVVVLVVGAVGVVAEFTQQLMMGIGHVPAACMPLSCWPIR